MPAVGNSKGGTSNLTDAQKDKMVELHDRYGMTYRAIGARYGISEKKAFRVVKERRRQP